MLHFICKERLHKKGNSSLKKVCYPTRKIFIYVYVYTYMNFTSFMKDFCRVSWLEIRPEAANIAEMLTNKGKLQRMSKATVGLSSELHTRARPHTFKNLGCKTGRMQSCTLIFFKRTTEQHCLQVVEHLQMLLRGQLWAHQKASLLHRHSQRAAGSHLVRLVTARDTKRS